MNFWEALAVALIAGVSTLAGYLILARPARCAHGVSVRKHCTFCCTDPCHLAGDPGE